MAAAVNLRGGGAEETPEMAIEYKYDGMRLQVLTTQTHLDCNVHTNNNSKQGRLHIAMIHAPGSPRARGRSSFVHSKAGGCD